MEHRGGCAREGVGNLGQAFEREKELGVGELLEGPGEGAEGGKGEAGVWVVVRALEGRRCPTVLTANPFACVLVCVWEGVSVTTYGE